MGERGPAAKPTRLKEVQGNPGKRALNRREPRPEQGPMPQCPRWLVGAARAEWHRVARQLYNIGLLTQVDRGVLALYCVAWGHWVEAEAARRGQPDVVETTNGNLVMNPWVSVSVKAGQDVLKYAAQLGMTPAARSRIAVETPEGDSLAEALWG